MEIDLKKLKELYIDNNMTMEEVGNYFGVSKIKIKNILKNTDIRKNKKNIIIDTNCSNCGKPIQRNEREYNRCKNHFCSYECKFNFKKVKVNCLFCGKEKYISKSKFELNNNFFCDNNCYKLWKKENSYHKCCICGKEGFNVKKYKEKYYCKKHYNHMYRHGEILDYTIHDENEIIEHNDYLEIVLKDVKGIITGYTYIDKENYEKIKGYKIYKSREYARINLQNGQKKNLHNFIMDCPKNKVVDHINQDFHDGIIGTLDNRKMNLRIATTQKNSFNMKKDIKKGIRENKNNFSCHIMIDYKNIWLGSYNTFEESVIARMISEIYIFKEFRNISLDDEKIKIYNEISKDKLCIIKNKIQKYLIKNNINIDKDFYDQYIQNTKE